MENYYAASYPDSGESSPRSREVDFENPQPWEDHAAAGNANYKVKFMCSYGGKINPRPHDNQLSYIGGETKILAVERNIKFAGLVGKLSALCDADVCFKYQLPGEDLDALISVTNDDDLEHMMNEYDRWSRASSKPARLRLFLFPVNQTGPESFGSTEEKSDREKFVEALNSAPIHSSPVPSTVAPPGNVDYLFGLDKGIPPQPTVSTKVHDLASDRGIPSEDRAMAADPVQRQIQDFQRLQIGGQEQAMYPRKSDDNLAGGFPGDYYVHKLPEKVPPPTLPMSSPPGYWPEKHVAGGVYPVSAPVPEQQVYMIPAPTGVYHAPMTRQVTGPPGQGYYAVQRMPPEVYREQPSVYNVPQPPTAATAVASPTLPPQPLPKVAGFSEGIGMAGYTAMAYDSGAGRQVYYTAPGGAMAAAPAPASYQGIPTAVTVEGRSAGAPTVDGKVTVKPPQGSM